ncbi:MAG: hypothetical protein Q9223_005880 [Gallowayella weberi]
MAPQGDIPIAANVLGTIGTVFWCIQLIPQIWYNWKQKKTDGLPGLMMFIWAVSAVPFGVYAIVQRLASMDSVNPCSRKWHCLRRHPTPSRLDIENQGPYSRGVEWPMTLVGVISAVLLASGLIPPYFEIAKRNGRVVGINFVFLSIDWLGAFFSLMALGVSRPSSIPASLLKLTLRNLVAQSTFDVLGGVQYIVCLLLEAGIFTSHLIFLLRTRSLRRRAKESQVKFDEMPEARRFVFPRPGNIDPAHSAEDSDSDRGLPDIEKGPDGNEERREDDSDHEFPVIEKGPDGSGEKRAEEMEAKKSIESGRARSSSAAAGRWPVRQPSVRG